MKKNYHLDELEAFLSDSADQQRMYPSDRVWRNIDKELHGQKKWPALTFGVLLTGAIITAGLILVHPDKNLLQVDPHLTEQKSSQKSETFGTDTYRETTPVSADNKQIANAGGNLQPTMADQTVAYADFGNGNHDQNLVTPNAGIEENWMTSYQAGINEHWTRVNGLPSGNQIHPNAGLSVEPTLMIEKDLVEMTTNTIAENKVAGADFTEDQNTAAPSALNKNLRKSKWGIEYYFTPSYSYRYLTESKIVDFHQQSQQNGPIASNLINPVNNFVNHKPTLGLEAGAGVVYQATDKLRLSAGLQFNMRGYNIEAFASGIEPSTIVLNRGYYTDSIFALSSYNTQSGYKEVNMVNRYWQLSVPIGLQYQVTNGKKVNLSISASVQPTYQFSNSEYILSHDYRNYLQQPDLVKRWNINTAIGAVISYEAAGVTWQVGPQIRYQAGSGTVKEYPIKEHLIDYGLRIGVVKTLK